MIPRDHSKIPLEFGLAVKLLPRKGDVDIGIRSQIIGRLEDFQNWNSCRKSPKADRISKKGRFHSAYDLIESIEQFKARRRVSKGKEKDNRALHAQEIESRAQAGAAGSQGAFDPDVSSNCTGKTNLTTESTSATQYSVPLHAPLNDFQHEKTSPCITRPEVTRGRTI